jgi:hypothetical protein
LSISYQVTGFAKAAREWASQSGTIADKENNGIESMEISDKAHELLILTEVAAIGPGMVK